MEHLDLLQTIAAIAITLIGFIGIVVTTGRLADGHHRPIDRVVFYSMVAPTLTALFCAFMPELLASLALPPPPRGGSPMPCSLDSFREGGYTNGMKTAVSIPDPIFDEAELLARQLGTSRSEIYARALRAFISNYAPDRVTQQVNDVVDSVGTASDDFANAAARRVLGQIEW